MSKKPKRPPKNGAVWCLTSEEATLARKPRYNGFTCGHGAHGPAKYNRAQSKRAWRNDMQKGPHGPFFSFSTAFVGPMRLHREKRTIANDPLPQCE